MGLPRSRGRRDAVPAGCEHLSADAGCALDAWVAAGTRRRNGWPRSGDCWPAGRICSQAVAIRLRSGMTVKLSSCSNRPEDPDILRHALSRHARPLAQQVPGLHVRGRDVRAAADGGECRTTRWPRPVLRRPDGTADRLRSDEGKATADDYGRSHRPVRACSSRGTATDRRGLTEGSVPTGARSTLPTGNRASRSTWASAGTASSRSTTPITCPTSSATTCRDWAPSTASTSSTCSVTSAPTHCRWRASAREV